MSNINQLLLKMVVVVSLIKLMSGTCLSAAAPLVQVNISDEHLVTLARQFNKAKGKEVKSKLDAYKKERGAAVDGGELFDFVKRELGALQPAPITPKEIKKAKRELRFNAGFRQFCEDAIFMRKLAIAMNVKESEEEVFVKKLLVLVIDEQLKRK